MMNPAHCSTCGERVAHNPKAMGRMSTQYAEPRPLSGWYHNGTPGNSPRRDHEAAPHDMRSPEVEAQRTGERDSFARMQVEHHLGKQFDQLNMEKAVNDVFHDRRST